MQHSSSSRHSTTVGLSALVFIALVFCAVAAEASGPRRASDTKAAGVYHGHTKDQAGTARIDELWEDPGDISARDLFYGPGGRELAPDPAVEYRFKSKDTKGHSDGYDVLDPAGKAWDVKVGEEAQSEVVTSRILWAIGYHQPAVYLLSNWRMTGGPKENPGAGRFRLASDHKVLGTWSWTKNPFRNDRAFRGLVIANLLLNNWDLSPSNNRVYHLHRSAGEPRTVYVVQDVGASLGRTAWPIGSRNNIDEFESQDLVKAVKDGRVQFDYHARHRSLLEDITPDDVVWTCKLLAQLSDKQLDEAFRAAGYTDALRERYIRKIRQKINEGLSLDSHEGVPH